MTDENCEELTPEVPEDAPVSEDVSFTEISPEPVETDTAPDSAPTPEPDPVEPSASVEVVTVDDLLDRLAGESQEDTQTEESLETEESPQEEEAVLAPASGSGLPAAQVDGGPLEVIGMDLLLKRLETIQQQTDEHPMMETPFEDYTVTEGLMLLIFVILLLDFFLNILRRWF